MKKDLPIPITVGDLINRLSGFPKHAIIDFGATVNADNLHFLRVKSRHSEDEIIQIELVQESLL